MSHGKLEVYVQGAAEVKDNNILEKRSPGCTLTTSSQECSTPLDILNTSFHPSLSKRPMAEEDTSSQTSANDESARTSINNLVAAPKQNKDQQKLAVPHRPLRPLHSVAPKQPFSLDNFKIPLMESHHDRRRPFHPSLVERRMTEEDSSSQSSDDGSLRPNTVAAPQQKKAQQKSAVPYRPTRPPPGSIGVEQSYSTVHKALLVNRLLRFDTHRGCGRGPFNPLPSKRHMTEEDSSSDDDNASAPYESRYQQPHRGPEPPRGPPPRRPTPLSNTNTNSLLQTFGGASMQNVGGALLYHDGDGADWGGSGGDDKEVSTTSYANAPEEYLENYDVDSGYEDTECCDDIYAIANNSSCQARESTSDVEKKSTHADQT